MILFIEISYIILIQFRLNTVDQDMLKISSKITGDADTNTEFSLTTLSNNFFCANIIPQSQQSI